MARRTAIDGDTGEQVELDGQVHCFIIRLGDDQFEALERHRKRLECAVKKPVSRAAAAREALSHVLPRRPRRAPKNQTYFDFFGTPMRRDPRIATEAERVAQRALDKLVPR